MNSRRFNTIATLLFFGLAWVYFAGNKEALTGLTSISIPPLIFLSVAKLLRILTAGIFTKITLRAFEKDISISETNYLAILTAVGNFFGPLLGGASIRAIYLKTKHGFQYSKFVSTMYGYYVITFTVYSAIGLLLLMNTFNLYGAVEGFQLAMLLLVGVFLAGLVAISLPTKYGLRVANMKRISSAGKYIRMAVNGWAVIKSHHGMLRKLILLSLAVLFLASLESLALYTLFVDGFVLSSVILYTILGAFSMLISLTPGAIGIKEGVYLILSSVLLISNEQVIQMATVDRSVAFLLLFVLFILTKTKYFSPKTLTKN